MDLVNRIQRFYDPNQQREQGRFADEGKGSQHPGQREFGDKKNAKWFIDRHADFEKRAQTATSDSARNYYKGMAERAREQAGRAKSFIDAVDKGEAQQSERTFPKIFVPKWSKDADVARHLHDDIVSRIVKDEGVDIAQADGIAKTHLQDVIEAHRAENEGERMGAEFWEDATGELAMNVVQAEEDNKTGKRTKLSWIQQFYNPDQLRDQGGKFADEGKGSQESGYRHPNEAGLKGIDKRLVDYVAHRPLARSSPEVRSVGSYIKNMHYVPYSHTPFFDQLNKMQGTRDPLAIPIAEFAAARKELFRKQPKEKLKIKNLIATQPVVNGAKVQRNVDEENLKRIFVVRYEGKQYVMDGHHALMAAADMGKKNIKARVLELVKPPASDADLHRYIGELSKTERYKEVTEHQRHYGATQEKRENWSKHINSDNDGNYTPRRKALHQKIVDSMINPRADVPKDQTPSITFLIGASGSGKGTVGRPYADAFGPATYINPDDIRKQFPENNGMNAPATQQEAKDVHKQLGAAALARHQNIIEDVTGSKPDKIDAQVTEWGKAGYNVNVVDVHVPLHQSIERVWNRYQQEGRFVDTNYLLYDVDSNPLRTYAKVKENPAVKNWISIDNSGKQPKVTDKGHR